MLKTVKELTKRLVQVEHKLDALIVHFSSFNLSHQVERTLSGIPPVTPPGSPVKMIREKAIICYDLETTSIGDTSKIGIREIAAICGPCPMWGEKDRDTQYDVFRSAVNPEMKTSKAAQDIAPVDITDAETWDIVGTSFARWIHGQLGKAEPQPKLFLCGWNSKRFDSRILMFNNAKYGVDFTQLARSVFFVDLLEIVKMMRPEIKAPRKLATVHKKIVGGPMRGEHTAMGDSDAVRSIALQLSINDEERFWTLIDEKSETLWAVMKRCKLC